jgi:hypothetical protein
VFDTPNQRRLKRQVRRPLERSEEAVIEEEVADALAATPAERMEAAVALLDAAFSLMESDEENRDPGLCRFPGMSQERRHGLCRGRGDGGPVVRALPDDP